MDWSKVKEYIWVLSIMLVVGSALDLFCAICRIFFCNYNNWIDIFYLLMIDPDKVVNWLRWLEI